jgi:Fe-S-cluster containining protein
VSPATSDIIKIKSAAENDSTCLYLDTDRICCTIYEQRPYECRLMACWDTQAIMEGYRKDRLTRDHLLTRFAGLSNLITEHQQRCNYQDISQCAEIIRKGNSPAKIIEKLLALMRYDVSLRKVTVEQTRLDPEMLDFLFGRPLSVTIRMFHLKLVEQGESLTIVPYI